MRGLTLLVAGYVVCSTAMWACCQGTPDPRDLLRTAAAASEARERSVPPLAVCGVYRGFYTPLHWRVWNDTMEAMNDGHRFDPATAGDRAAVGVGLWESPATQTWQREYQGLYRGPNDWVWSATPAAANMVADMHRMEFGAADRVTVLDFLTGYPLITVTRSRASPAWEPLGGFLGLVGPVGPVSAVLRAPLDEADCVPGPAGREGSVLTLSMARTDALEANTEEQVLQLDTARGFAPLRYRFVRLREGRGGIAHEIRWEKLAQVGPEVWLPASMVHWEFSYAHPDLGTLRQTKAFGCLSLKASQEGPVLLGLPKLALLNRTASHAELLANTERAWGSAMLDAVRDFVHEVPPAPPGDLLRLDPEAGAEDIRQRYGLS